MTLTFRKIQRKFTLDLTLDFIDAIYGLNDGSPTNSVGKYFFKSIPANDRGLPC